MRPRDIIIIKKRNNPSYVLKHFFIETIEKKYGIYIEPQSNMDELQRPNILEYYEITIPNNLVELIREEANIFCAGWRYKKIRSSLNIDVVDRLLIIILKK